MMALTDDQLNLIMTSAKLLNRSARDPYLRSVANRLNGIREPTNDNVRAAIKFTLDCLPRFFSCDSKEGPNK